MMEKTNKNPDKIFVGSWLKKNGQLSFYSKQEEEMFKALTKGIRNGGRIFFMVDFADDNGTLQQIAKVKAGTRDLARETGHSFIEVENEIKRQCGMYDEVNETYKSFAHASREELSAAIQIMINIGENVGLNLR